MAGPSLPTRFQKLWVATAVSNFGDGVRVTAMPLLALSITTDPRAIAGVAVADRVPWLVFILPGGLVADRVDRLRLRILLDTLRCGLVAAFGLSLAIGSPSIWLLYLTVAGLSAGEAVVDSSSMALAPSMVQAGQLEQAGARLASTEIVGQLLVGPALGGMLFAVGAVLPFAMDAASFGIAAIVCLGISGTFRPPSHLPNVNSWRSDLIDGMRWLRRYKDLMRTAIVAMTLGFFAFMANGVFVLFARQRLGVGDIGYGLILIPAAIGGVVGSVVAPRMVTRSLNAVLASSTMVSGVALTLMAQQSATWSASVLIAIASAGSAVWNVLTLAFRQRSIPDELLGRVGACYRFLVYLGMPVGAAVGGVLAARFGAQMSVSVAGLGTAAVGATAFWTLRGVEAAGGISRQAVVGDA